jgi:hypothetical protein
MALEAERARLHDLAPALELLAAFMRLSIAEP